MEICSGFRILALDREIERSKIEYEVHKWFEGRDWHCSDTEYGTTITYQPTGQEVKVSFEKVKYPSENDVNAETYHVRFDVSFFDFRANAQKTQRDFFLEIFHKIRWKKRGMWFRDGKKIPISRRTILRRK